MSKPVHNMTHVEKLHMMRNMVRNTKSDTKHLKELLIWFKDRMEKRGFNAR